MMELSLILPVCNDAGTIGEQLDAIAAEKWSGQWECIVSDNGSTDGSIEIAKAYKGRIPNLKFVDASDRRGAAHARNKAVEIAVGETVAFIDADDVISEGWIAAIAEAAGQYEFMASRFDYKKLCEQPEQEYGGGTQIAGIQRMWWPPFYPHSGACGIAIKKRLHNAVGGFDENLLRLQDTDYCIRLCKEGVRLKFVPEALIHIRNRKTYKGVFRQAKSWGQYNALLYKRYRLKDEKLPHAFRRYCRDAYRATKQAVRGPMTAGVVYQLGWHVGLLQGCLMYRVAPPVVGLVTIPNDLCDADESSDEATE
jgi:glycosyltransferase involved in cell wall biosynthesis